MRTNEQVLSDYADKIEGFEKAKKRRALSRKVNRLVGFVFAVGCFWTGATLMLGMIETGNRFYGLFGMWNVGVYCWVCINIPNKHNDRSEQTGKAVN